jgi:hypothetical protein
MSRRHSARILRPNSCSERCSSGLLATATPMANPAKAPNPSRSNSPLLTLPLPLCVMTSIAHRPSPLLAWGGIPACLFRLDLPRPVMNDGAIRAHYWQCSK